MTLQHNALERNLINFKVYFKFESAAQNLPIQSIMKQNKNLLHNLLIWNKYYGKKSWNSCY